MPSTVGMAAQIVAAQASSTAMSTEEILSSLTRIHSKIGQLLSGATQAQLSQSESSPELPLTLSPAPMVQPENEAAEAVSKVPEAVTKASELTAEKSLGENEIVCMICGKSFQVLGRHLMVKHGMKPKEYRRQFGISARQPLSSQVSYQRSKQLGTELATSRKEVPVPETAKPAAEVKVKRGRPKGSKSRSPRREEKTAAVKAPKAEVVKIAAQPAAS